ncbi:RNA polymerase III subunit Rpc82 [Zalerion maritima]|uniref:DNA-directed RNA polymerase III subunit RPC3 n=1 Tax=Zalerion maritima TaxID=339359 RepID=A0AAD5WY38_9PEZI|nr:RNA polymerase III subunit Rpc82 [Zalerion maritima]
MGSASKTPNYQELCAKFVRDIHGELPSRIFEYLCNYGASSVERIGANLSMSHKERNSSIAILYQLNLLYYWADPDTRSPTIYYEANHEAAYNLIRKGKIVNVVAQEYGNEAGRFLETLATFGHARIRDLAKTFIREDCTPNGGLHVHEKSNGNGDVLMENGYDGDEDPHLEEESIGEKFNSMVADLLCADVLELCSINTFKSPRKLRASIEKQVIKSKYNGVKPKGSKGQEQFLGYVREELEEVRNQPRVLKEQLLRRLGNARRDKFENKKTKTENGTGVTSYLTWEEIDPSAVVRINYFKTNVLLRNTALVKHASNNLGYVKGQVYAVALRIMEKNIERCHPDPYFHMVAPNELGKTIRDLNLPPVTTLEIVSELPEDLDVSMGIGRAPKNMVNKRRAERVRPNPRKERLPYIDKREIEESSGEDVDDDEYQDDQDIDLPDFDARGDDNGKVNLNGDSDVKFVPRRVGLDSKVYEDPRLQNTREHLLGLSEASQHYIRHSGEEEGGEWVVDFAPLISKIQKFEMDLYIKDKFSRRGVRLVNILRQFGKLDEKALASKALMLKKDVSTLLNDMMVNGLAEIQEVPKDNNRQANRTIFLWFFDDDRARAQLLSKQYKIMTRLQQVLDVERHKNREILELYNRSDVRGREEEMLHPNTIKKYGVFQKRSRALLTQMMRLDEVISIFRDY